MAADSGVALGKVCQWGGGCSQQRQGARCFC